MFLCRLSMDNLHIAIKEWRNILGKQRVLSSVHNLKDYETATFETSSKVAGAIRLQNVLEVKACIKVANKYRVPVHPISAGKNWGFGSSVPVRDAVIFDLTQLNEIKDYNAKLGYVTVQPGVTFSQLHKFLKSKGDNLMVSTPGTSPLASVLANAIERGHGSGLHADRFANVCGLTIVLADGQILHSGMRRFQNARAASVFKWGVGPFVDGLFSQSNLGIVVEMTVWLTPIPKHFELCRFFVNDPSRLRGCLSQLQRLKAENIVPTPISLWNDFKVLSTLQRYPWEDSHFQTPITRSLRSTIQSRRHISLWSGSIGIYAASEGIASATSELIVEYLKNTVDDLILVNSKRVFHPFGEQGATHSSPKDFANTPWLGTPTQTSVTSAYWRKKHSPSSTTVDLDRDMCGKYTISIPLPFDDETITECLQLCEKCLEQYGFEPVIALLAMSARYVEAVLFLLYDRLIKDEDTKARACHTNLSSSLLKQGFIQSRVGITSMHYTSGQNSAYQKVVGELKLLLDPNRIISPGRYDYLDFATEFQNDT